MHITHNTETENESIKSEYKKVQNKSINQHFATAALIANQPSIHYLKIAEEPKTDLKEDKEPPGSRISRENSTCSKPSSGQSLNLLEGAQRCLHRIRDLTKVL